MNKLIPPAGADALASFFVATLLAAFVFLISESVDLSVIAWTTALVWCFEGGANLDRAQWIHSSSGVCSPQVFLKNSLALALWPLVAYQIQKTRGKLK